MNFQLKCFFLLYTAENILNNSFSLVFLVLVSSKCKQIHEPNTYITVKSFILNEISVKGNYLFIIYY